MRESFSSQLYVDLYVRHQQHLQMLDEDAG